MYVELGKYLRTFDLTGYTAKEIYVAKVRTVSAAIRVPVAEQAFRASLKDEPALEEISKTNDLLVKGRIGRTGAFFKKTFQLPLNGK